MKKVTLTQLFGWSAVVCILLAGYRSQDTITILLMAGACLLSSMSGLSWGMFDRKDLT